MTAAAPARVVAIDVDGTLLTSDHRITPAVAAALERVRARGVAVVLTTSRPPRAVWPILAELGLVDPEVFIASQGALTGSYTEGGELRVIDRQPMPVQPARAVSAAGAAAGLAVNWFAGERWLVPHIDDRIRQEAAIVGCSPEVADLALVSEAPDKILLLGPLDCARGGHGRRRGGSRRPGRARLDVDPSGDHPCRRGQGPGAAAPVHPVGRRCRREWWRSATAATTWGCCPSQGSAWRRPTPIPTCSQPWTS